MSLKIMVVDDEVKFPNLMRVLATPLGYTVLPFQDYQLAGQKGESQRFDVCFVSMRPPEPGQPDGLELARRIRNSSPNREALIIMLSSGDNLAEQRKAYGEGADVVLSKPLPPDSVRRMLAAFPEWKVRSGRVAARLPLFTEVTCTTPTGQFVLRSVNISESGMLLQPSVETEVGGEVSLAFGISEIRASIATRARVARKEGSERLGAQFIDLSPEDRNAIQLYVTGHSKNIRESREDNQTRFGTSRLFRP